MDMHDAIKVVVVNMPENAYCSQQAVRTRKTWHSAVAGILIYVVHASFAQSATTPRSGLVDLSLGLHVPSSLVQAAIPCSGSKTKDNGSWSCAPWLKRDNVYLLKELLFHVSNPFFCQTVFELDFS